MNNIEVIGLDHGWSQIKTANSTFVSGVSELAKGPTFMDDVLEYNERYYKIGTERMDVKDSKVENDNYYLLTLAGIAKELKARGKTEADIILAVGLPLTRFADEKKDFVKYITRNGIEEFSYEEVKYKIRILKVNVYPQCYAAVINLIPTFGTQVLAVDVGSWTIDIMPIINRKPNDPACNTKNDGVIRCIKQIQKRTIKEMNGKLDEIFITEYMMTGKTTLSSYYVKIIDEEIRIFVKKIFDSLREEGYNLEVIPVVFVGGGANLVKKYGDCRNMHISFVSDVKANAIGYEILARAALRKG